MALVLLPPYRQPSRNASFACLTAAATIGSGRLVVVLKGEADVASRAVLCDLLTQVIAQQVGDVIIDMSNLTVVDRSAVRVLAMGHWLLNAQGRKLILRSPSTMAAQILGTFGLDESIEAEKMIPDP
jgi:anti-anti-sigma factor